MKHNDLPTFTSQAPAHTPAHARTRLYVLIACEESQAECAAFRELGHIAYSCDIQPCRPTGNPDYHIQGDVTPLLQGSVQFTTQSGIQCEVPGWDLIIAHPPCTYLCRVGSYWLWYQGRENGKKYPKLTSPDPVRYAKMLQARAFFFICLNAKAQYVAVENPQPMALAQLPHPSCYVNPSWFGVKYTKKTLYWLKNLPPIMPELIHPNPKEFVRASRGKYRSRTFPQLAQAIARQWSEYILDDINKQPP